MTADPAPDPIMGPERLSPSGLATWAQCPRKWWAKYVLGVEDPPGPEAERGTRVHAVLEALAQRPTAERTLETAAAVTREVLADDTVEDRRAVWPHVVRAVRLTPFVGVDVIGTEQTIETVLDGVPFRGVVDRADRLPDGTVGIVDYKTGAVPMAGRSGDKAIQVTAYAAAWEGAYGERVSSGTLVFTVTGERIVVRTHERAKADTVDKIRVAWDGITEGVAVLNAGGPPDDVFPAAPGPLCSWCPAVGDCPAGIEATRDRAYKKRQRIGPHGQAALDAQVIGAMEATVAVTARRHLRLVQP